MLTELQVLAVNCERSEAVQGLRVGALDYRYITVAWIIQIVIPGFVPGIHVGPTPGALQESLKPRPDVDGRDRPGHDGFLLFP